MTVGDDVARLQKQNAELGRLLESARSQLGELRERLGELSTPPQTFATLLGWEGDHADVAIAGRRMRVAVAPSVSRDLPPGQEGLQLLLASVRLRVELLLPAPLGLNEGGQVPGGPFDAVELVQLGTRP